MKLKALTFALSILSVSLIAQDNKNATDVVKNYVNQGSYKVNKGKKNIDYIQTDSFFKKLALSIGFSTMGFGLETATPLSQSFKIRAGVDYMPVLISLNKAISVKDDNLSTKVGGYYPDYDVDFKPSFFNGHIYLDYYPMRQSSFHVVGGVIIGSNDIKASGKLINPTDGSTSTLVNPNDTWPTLIVEGYELNIDDANLDASIRMGGTIKPYLGIGFGNILSNSRWNVNFDIGMIYQGTYSIRQDGKTASKIDGYTSSAIDIEKYTNMVKVLPMLNLQIAYRLF